MSQSPPLTLEQTRLQDEEYTHHCPVKNPFPAQHGSDDIQDDNKRDADADGRASDGAAPPGVLPPSELDAQAQQPRYVRGNARRRMGGKQSVKPAQRLSNGNRDKNGDSDSDDDSTADEDYPWVNTLPPETLSRILAHLDPISLARSASVCRLWSKIARDDVTWREAFSNAFGVGGTASIALRRTNKASWKQEYIQRTDLIRRWKRSRAPAISSDMRVSNIHGIAFSESLSFMLSASSTYGVASRSDPFKGKVARGFVDAAGILNGAGIGNPNVEFSPHNTAVALARDASRIAWGFRDGSLAMTLLTRQGSNPRGMIRNIRFSPRGSHLGEVTAIAFDLNQRGQTRRQQRRIAMGDAADCFVTGGQDGRVRLWTHHRAVPLWFAADAAAASTATNTTTARSPPDGITCLDLDADLGIIVAGTQTGDLHVWYGIDVSALLAISTAAWDDPAGSGSAAAATEIQTPAQLQARKALAMEHARVRHVVVPASRDAEDMHNVSAIDQIFLDAHGANDLSVITHRESENHLSVHRVNDSRVRTRILQTDAGLLESITCLRVDVATAASAMSASTSTSVSPALPPTAAAAATVPPPLVLGPAPGTARNLHDGVFAERKFVAAGTSSGKVFGWSLPDKNDDEDDGDDGVSRSSPNFKLDCHHTAVTCVDFTPHLFAVGTSDGTVKTFNALTGELVRTWTDRSATRHAARMLNEGVLTPEEADRFRVRQIVVGDESIVAAVGPFILAWRPGSATSGRRNKGNAVGEKNSAGNGPSSSAAPSSSSARSGLPPLSKYAQMREIKTELAESSTTLAREREARQASYERLRYARGPGVGLEEDEALEYAMMLSREDEEARRVREAQREGEADVQLSELARIRKEEDELQEALEQIALAEADESASSSVIPSSRASDAGVDSGEHDDGDDGDDGDGQGDKEEEEGVRSPTLLSPGPSPGLTGYGSPSRAWTILNTSRGSASPAASSSSAKYSRWGEHSKVRTVSVPRASRLSLSPSTAGSVGQSLTPPHADSPEHWPAMLSTSASSSSGGGKSPLDAASSGFSLGPPRRDTGKQPERGNGGPAFLASGPNTSPSTPAGPRGAWAKGSPQVATPAANAQRASPLLSPSPAVVPAEMDDDLRFAIELSLAEERSRWANE